MVWISSVTGIDHLRLVCHPFYERQPPPKKLQFYRCYDLLNLGIPTQGIWHIALSLTGCGDDMKLVMERHYTHWTKKYRRLFDKHTFPLYYNGGENCIHIVQVHDDNAKLLEMLTKGYRPAESKAKKQRRKQPVARHPASSGQLGVRNTRRRLSRRLQESARQADKAPETRSVENYPATEDTTLLEDPVEQYVRQTLAETLSQGAEVGSSIRHSSEAYFVPVDLDTTASSSLGHIEGRSDGLRPGSSSHPSADTSSYSPSSYFDDDDDDDDDDYDSTSLHDARGQMPPQLKAALRTPRQSASRHSKRQTWSQYQLTR